MGGQALKPTNLGSKGCSPTSSDCVIWQGDDIECLNICKGASVSDVMFQMGCLLCKLKDQLDPDTYDLTCLELAACDVPHTFPDFIQLIIDRICNIEATCCNDVQSNPNSELTVVVAACFSAEGGPLQTISNYIMAIGTKVCEQEITIQNQNIAIQQLLARVEVLEA
jgi:hypothetical protein